MNQNPETASSGERRLFPGDSLKITVSHADDELVTFVNGKKIGAASIRTHGDPLLNIHVDLTDELVTGRNVILVVLANRAWSLHFVGKLQVNDEVVKDWNVVTGGDEFGIQYHDSYIVRVDP